MQFINSTDPQIGTQALADKVSSLLNDSKKVLWLIPGGSNIPISVEAMNIIRGAIPDDSLKNLTISLTDERYGPVGHEDSNWKQLADAGMDFDALNEAGVRLVPVLRGSDLTGTNLAETVGRFGANIEEALKSVDIVIGQFGMGADGHIAGILPHSPAVSETAPACGYGGKPFNRITLTPPILKQIDVAYAFVLGDPKRAAIENLRNKNLSLDEQPAQILKNIPEAYLYTDILL